jgi:hypothetical protein
MAATTLVEAAKSGGVHGNLSGHAKDIAARKRPAARAQAKATHTPTQAAQMTQCSGENGDAADSSAYGPDDMSSY